MVMPWIIAGAATPEIAEQLVSERPEYADQAVVEAIVQRVTASGEQKREWYNEIYAPQSGVEVATTQPEAGQQAGLGIGGMVTGGGGGGELDVLTAGFSEAGLVGVAEGIIGGLNIPGWLASLLGMAAGWGISELMGGNGGYSYEGGGAVADGAGITVSGGTYIDGIPFGGPGVPEPPAGLVAKAWKTKAFSKTAGEYWVYFWKLMDGRILSWNAAKRQAKIWRPKKPIVMYRGKVTLSQAVKAQRMLDRLWRTVAKRTKALKLA